MSFNDQSEAPAFLLVILNRFSTASIYFTSRSLLLLYLYILGVPVTQFVLPVFKHYIKQYYRLRDNLVLSSPALFLSSSLSHPSLSFFISHVANVFSQGALLTGVCCDEEKHQKQIVLPAHSSPPPPPCVRECVCVCLLLMKLSRTAAADSWALLDYPR